MYLCVFIYHVYIYTKGAVNYICVVPTSIHVVIDYINSFLILFYELRINSLIYKAASLLS